MRLTAGLTAREYAKFVVDHTPDPTEGTIIDALREAGADDEEIQDALDFVLNEVSVDTDIDIPNDVDEALEENEKQLEDIEEEIEEGNTPLDSMPVDVPGDLAESIGGDSEEEPEFDDSEFAEDPMGFNPSESEDSVEMQPDELFETMNQYLSENPGASQEDLTRYLHSLGMPGDKINQFLENGMDMLKASSLITDFIFTSASSDISWMSAAQFVREHNPNMSIEQLRQALLTAGASRVEVEEVINQLPPDQPEMPEQPVPDQMADPTMDPNGQSMQPAPPMPPNRAQAKTEIRSNTGERTSPNYSKDTYMSDNFDPKIQDRVQTPKGSARVAGVLPSFSGDIYEVVLANGSVEHYGIGALSAYQEEKTASTGIFQRVASHVEEEWYTDNVVLPRSHKAGYEKRLAATEELIKEVKSSIKTASAEEQVELMKIDVVLSHEARYLRDKIATAFTAEDADYLGSQPKYRVSASHTASDMGHRTAALDIAVSAAEEEASQVDWKHEVTAGAELFVEEISPVLIGSSGEVRRMAARHIDAKTAALDEEKASTIRNSFIENAEKARRRVVKELRQATPKQASTDLPDGSSDEGVFL